jgi:hypothetical protein
MDQISIKTPQTLNVGFFKNCPIKVLGGRCFLSEAPRTPPSSPLVHTGRIYAQFPIHTGKGEMWTNEKVRGALVHTRGRKYQHDWLYLQSINSIKHQWRRHLGFGVFTDFWSMGYGTLRNSERGREAGHQKIQQEMSPLQLSDRRIMASRASTVRSQDHGVTGLAHSNPLHGDT